MNLENIGEIALRNLGRINIIIGKNGSGKSRLLRDLHNSRGAIQNLGVLTYITPERGGVLSYEAGVENDLVRNPQNFKEQRITNQFFRFKEQTVAQYRKLKDLVHAKMEKYFEQLKSGRDTALDPPMTFQSYVVKLNSLLDEIELRQAGATFQIFKKGTDREFRSSDISSGESELIALGIECLVFENELASDRLNILLLDEPDVHLHPDLQVRLMGFVRDQVERNDFCVIIATHSIAILGALGDYAHAHIAFMRSGDRQLTFEEIGEVYKKILPVFGAHPLSNLFNEAPVLLVEGEDDERIWQQAVRTSSGKIRVYPCGCGGVDRIAFYEEEVAKIIRAVYDNAKAFSLRDRDDMPEQLTDLPPIIRMRLSCRSAENLLLSNQVLSALSMNWVTLRGNIEAWLGKNKDHPHHDTMNAFREGGFDRKGFDLKEIRNDLMGIVGNNKPWEVAVGQTLGSLWGNDTIDFQEEGSIYNFLGEKILANIFPRA